MLFRTMASALALTGAAYAQTPPQNETPATATPTTSSSDRLVYEPEFFAQYNPQTALDMVRQVPGFSLDGGADRRGFSGAVGNLLIDGLRPSTKSQSVDGILSRIPANQVVRLEVLRGAAVAGDASGQAMLLNVVRTPTAGSGVYEAGFEYTSRDVAAPRGEVSYSGRNGQVEYGIGGSIFSQYRDLPGWRRVYEPPAPGEPATVHVRDVDTPSPRDFREATLNGNIAFPLMGGRLGANTQLNAWRFGADNDFIHTTPSGDPLVDLLTEFKEERFGYEVGLNYDRDFGPWTLALIGLANRGTYESEEVGDNIDYVDPAESFTYVQDVVQETGETIARATLARPLGERHRIEFGGEGAFNTLDQELSFIQNGTPIVIPDSNVLVEEERAEFFGSHTWRPADAWSLETRLAWETSTLTFTGQTNQEVELSFWKPSVQLSRTFSGNNQGRIRIYRDVGQLDFGDFVSAAAVADALIAGGNPDLTPQNAWIAELGADLRFGPAALSLTLAHHRITDVADLVPITATVPNPNEDPLIIGDETMEITFDAPGNIGDGEITQLDVNLSTPISFIPGSRLTVRGYLRDTEVEDPVTGEARVISYTPESEVSISFRQDINSWRFSWGVEAFKQGEFQAYRLNEIDTNEEGPWIDLWVETTALPNNMKLRLWAANAFDGNVNRDRRFFDPDRSGTLVSRDLRERAFANAPWFIVELSGTF
ncbi:MAG TPA: TonB-dependent receptor [Candidatus Binatia bacterium]|nr:TonB-dependent receptor [Candidatus Binatia bacterium]